MQKEMPLDRRRWSDARPDALGETRRQPVLAGKEGEEQPAQLVLIAEPEFQPDVYPARPDQRRVESFGVVGRHEQEPPLLRRDAVESVQQAGEGQPSPGLSLCRAARERRIDILDEQEPWVRCDGKEAKEPLVVEVRRGEIDQAEIEVERTRNRPDERRLACSRWAREQRTGIAQV